jgi:hypothetical protein
MNKLIETTLKECRINREKRFHSGSRQPGGERRTMLLGDSNIEKTFRKFPGEFGQSSAGGHRGG